MEERLETFIQTKKIPNIILYGSERSNKEEILTEFLDRIYKDNKEKQNKILNINCAETNQGGIKFIREDLKFFSKSMIHNSINKTVILHNADKLTQDAQSALRRCIEIYSKSTRFIIIVENKDSILNPILSRFCSIFIPDVKERITFPIKNNYFLSNIKILLKKEKNNDVNEIISFTNNLYIRGIHIFNLLLYLEKYKNIDEIYKYKLLCFIDMARQHITNEKIIMFMLLYFFILRCEIKIENIKFN
jgi:DNA polymerase III delta prime subunit